MIRLANESDVPALLEMMEDFNRVESIPWSSADGEAPLRKLLADPSLGRVAVLEGELGGEVAAYAVVTFGYDLEFGGRDAFLTEIYVRPGARSSGLGARLLAEVEAIAAADGVRALHLLVYPENEPAMALYEKAGFERSRRVMMSKRI